MRGKNSPKILTLEIKKITVVLLHQSTRQENDPCRLRRAHQQSQHEPYTNSIEKANV